MSPSILKSILTTLFCVFILNNILASENKSEFLHYVSKTDTSLSAELFTPDNSLNELKDLPAFFFFEPWGNGGLPLTLYHTLARKYHINLIGFNASRNGMDFTESIKLFSVIINELVTNYNLDEKKLCLVGFSGAGKVALKTIEQKDEIKYVIYGGATVDAYLNGKKVLGFAGRKDMNFTSLLDFDHFLNSKVNVEHFCIEYNGWHNWFDSGTMENSFIWFKLNLMKDGKLKKDTAFIETIKKQFQSEADTEFFLNKLLQAHNQLKKSIFFFHDLTATNWFDDKLAALEGLSAYKKMVKQNNMILRNEKEKIIFYENSYFTRDTVWWKDEIKYLNKHTDNEFQSLSNIRLLGHLSLSCYYRAMDLFELNKLDELETILTIYHMAAPLSPEQAFLRAVLYARQGNTIKSSDAFIESKQLGFKEWDITPNENILQYFKRRNLK